MRNPQRILPALHKCLFKLDLAISFREIEVKAGINVPKSDFDLLFSLRKNVLFALKSESLTQKECISIYRLVRHSDLIIWGE